MKLYRNITFAALLGLISINVFADTLTNFGSVTLPSSLSYNNSFASATTGTTFFDDYYFTIPNGTANSVTSSINLDSILGLTNLQARLYTGNTHQTGAVVPGTLMSAWGTTINYSPTVGVTTVVLNPISLVAGDYTLQIRGTVSGLSGGSYGGVLNIAQPVPEPETYGMLLAGIGLVGFAGRRKTRKLH
jgi:PEP-CTERM motif